MSTIYIDTSALIKLIVEETQSSAVSAYLDNAFQEGHQLCISRLTHTEIHCALKRRLGHSSSWKTIVNAVTNSLKIMELTTDDYLRAANSANALRSLDSLHLEVAQRINAQVLVTFDQELAAAARETGMDVPCSRMGTCHV